MHLISALHLMICSFFIVFPSLVIGKQEEKIITTHGKLFFAHDIREVHFNVNLSALIDTANSIHINTAKLKDFCNETLDQNNCNYFVNRLQYNEKLIDRDITFLNS